MTDGFLEFSSRSRTAYDQIPAFASKASVETTQQSAPRFGQSFAEVVVVGAGLSEIAAAGGLVADFEGNLCIEAAAVESEMLAAVLDRDSL